jgi:undecaprenyl diphosphate synthase
MKTSNIPRHVAIIMDGNGRWARQRLMPRVLGHKHGVQSVRSAIEYCHGKGIDYLTLFAFSSENWQRPRDEVKFLMDLFFSSLENEIGDLDKNNVRFRVVGDRNAFSDKLRSLIDQSELKTRENTGLVLTIAANYGGRWDILNAVNDAIRHGIKNFDEESLRKFMQLNDTPEPDLCIRTGGEHRLSNFLIWDMAYTELYFTDVLWPDFDHGQFDLALADFSRRDRRFGQIDSEYDAEPGAA